MVLIDIRDFFALAPKSIESRSAELANALGTIENRPWVRILATASPSRQRLSLGYWHPFESPPALTAPRATILLRAILRRDPPRHLPPTSLINPSHRHNPITTLAL